MTGGKGLDYRLYLWEGQLYAVRDVYFGSRFLWCEYGVMSPAGDMIWRSCREGVAFREIEPIGKVEVLLPAQEEPS